MSRLVIFCAGTSIDTLPGTKVTNILFNPFDNGINEKAILATRTMLAYARTKIRFQDSGGYQIFKAEEESKIMTFDRGLPLIRVANRINICPTHVIETARRLEPQIMTSLDFPIRKLLSKNDQEQEFLRKSGFNVKWAIETASLRETLCPEVELLIPIQAYDLDQFEFFVSLIQDINFDGLSMPLRNLEPSEIALFLLRFYQLGIKKVHLLGSTSFFNIALAAFFARHFFDWVSLDSTTWRFTAEHQGYLNPYDLSWEDLADEVLINEKIPMICQCPFCENRTFSFIKNLPYNDKLAFLRSHNFWVIEKAAEDLYENATDLLSLERFLRRRSPRTKDIEDLIRCLSIIDIYRKEDINVLKRFLRIAA